MGNKSVQKITLFKNKICDVKRYTKKYFRNVKKKQKKNLNLGNQEITF